MDCIPFSFPVLLRALEAIFASIQLNYAREYEKIAQEVCDALDALANVKIASGELETLRVIKNDMNDFEAQVDGVRRALMELLDNEEDMRLLYLTKLHENPSLLFDLGSFDSEEVETILESYLKDIYSIRTSATLMQHRITTTESLVMMKLDYARNYLLALDMTLNLIAASLGFGMLVTGIFGMNLKIGIEDRTASAFWWVIFSVCGVCLFFILSGVFYFKHKGLLVTT
jgi:magnesium transporter